MQTKYINFKSPLNFIAPKKEPYVCDNVDHLHRLMGSFLNLNIAVNPLYRELATLALEKHSDIKSYIKTLEPKVSPVAVKEIKKAIMLESKNTVVFEDVEVNFFDITGIAVTHKAACDELALQLSFDKETGDEAIFINFGCSESEAIFTSAILKHDLLSPEFASIHSNNVNPKCRVDDGWLDIHDASSAVKAGPILKLAMCHLSPVLALEKHRIAVLRNAMAYPKIEMYKDAYAQLGPPVFPSLNTTKLINFFDLRGWEYSHSQGYNIGTWIQAKFLSLLPYFGGGKAQSEDQYAHYGAAIDCNFLYNELPSQCSSVYDAAFSKVCLNNDELAQQVEENALALRSIEL